MRFAVFIIAALLFTAPAMADSNPSTAHNYGGVTCPQQVQCSEDMSQVTALANSCVAQFFGFSGDGLFDESEGLDSGNCLTTNPEAMPKMASTKTIPHCCMIETANDLCAMHCDMVSSQ